MKTLTYTMDKTEVEQYATIGFHLAVDNMKKKGIISEDQAALYESYTCLIVTRDTVYEKLKKFFTKGEEGFDTLKVIAVPIETKDDI